MDPQLSTLCLVIQDSSGELLIDAPEFFDFAVPAIAVATGVHFETSKQVVPVLELLLVDGAFFRSGW
jgi:hypothetical protein